MTVQSGLGLCRGLGYPFPTIDKVTLRDFSSVIFVSGMRAARSLHFLSTIESETGNLLFDTTLPSSCKPVYVVIKDMSCTHSESRKRNYVLVPGISARQQTIQSVDEQSAKEATKE